MKKEAALARTDNAITGDSAGAHAAPANESARLLAGLQAIVSRLASGGARVANLRRLSGGASQQTWSFTVAGQHGEHARILRRGQPDAGHRGSANVGFAAEAQLFELAAAAGVPVPHVVHVLRPQDGLGDGFVMEHVEGETLGKRIVRDARLAHARTQLAAQCGEALARIHAIEPSTLPRLRVAPANVEMAFWLGQHRAYGMANPVFECAFQWLRRHLPPAPRVCTLVHGDFRNGNLIVTEAGLRAVLDWELAHIGDPMEDLGWLCVNSWRFGNADKPVGGFGTREQLFAAYEAGGGQVDPQRVRFWEVFGTLKWGIVCEGMVYGWLDGTEREIEKAAIGRRTSEAEIDLLAMLTHTGAASC
ncbi:phosphotransferase family protein [Paraburkholderia sp. J69-2]|uniref:phosphotransferase family protein n=1 Tax=Paraburkholderia sp. J69-2 TaxID=2805437 RepID=UPI002AB1C962|nr:phosphotransferase family protein [Paraburkholderia sp. J69-2]